MLLFDFFLKPFNRLDIVEQVFVLGKVHGIKRNIEILANTSARQNGGSGDDDFIRALK